MSAQHSLSVLGLSPRVHDQLVRAGITTAEAAVDLSEVHLLKLRGLDRRGMGEVTRCASEWVVAETTRASTRARATACAECAALAPSSETAHVLRRAADKLRTLAQVLDHVPNAAIYAAVTAAVLEDATDSPAERPATTSADSSD